MTTNSALDFAGIGLDAPQWPARRPMRLALLGDFGGGASRGRLETGADLARRKPLKVEFDTVLPRPRMLMSQRCSFGQSAGFVEPQFSKRRRLKRQ